MKRKQLVLETPYWAALKGIKIGSGVRWLSDAVVMLDQLRVDKTKAKVAIQSLGDKHPFVMTSLTEDAFIILLNIKENRRLSSYSEALRMLLEENGYGWAIKAGVRQYGPAQGISWKDR